MDIDIKIIHLYQESINIFFKYLKNELDLLTPYKASKTIMTFYWFLF